MGYQRNDTITDTGLGAFVFDGYEVDQNGNIINESPVRKRQRYNALNYVKKKDRVNRNLK